MAKLRKKLGSPAGQAIETVHGSGYRYFYDEPKLRLEQSRAPSTRSHSRKKVMWFARYATENITGTGVIRDASPNGVFLSLDNPDDLKRIDAQSMWLQIYVPVGDPLEIEGEVRWRGWNSTHNGHGFGLVFEIEHERIDALLHGRPDE